MYTRLRIAHIIGLVVAGLLLWSPGPAAAQPPEQALESAGIDVTFQDQGYADQMLRNEGDTASYVLYMPRTFQLSPDSYLEVVFDYMPIDLTIPVELEISLNNVLLGKFALSQNEAESNTPQRVIRSALAADALLSGSNQLDVKLRTHQVCGAYDPQVEVVIRANSYFHLVYDTPPLTPNLRDYPYPFYERTFRRSQVYIVLPQKPSAADLSAAATVSAGLGRFARVATRLAITSTLDSAVTSQVRDNYNLIVIGQTGRNSLLDQLSLPLDEQLAGLGPDDGVLRIVQSPWNPARAVLVITGQSDTALYRASAALNRRPILPGIRGQVSIIQDVLPPPPPPGEGQSIDSTFDRLGYEDQIVYGISPAWVRYTFYLPHNWEMLEAARLKLSLSHSPIIDPANSKLDVFLNGVPIGGTLLDKTNQSDGLLELELPTWLLRPGPNQLSLQLEMHFADEYCVHKNDPRAWTVIFKNSYLHLPVVASQGELNLGLFPAPFDGNGHFEETLFVVSEQWAESQRDVLFDLAVYLGSTGASNYLTLGVAYDTQVSEDIKAHKHLVIIGRPSRNRLFQEQAIAEALPQPFEPGSDTLIPRLETVVVQQLPDWSIGLLQEFASPWNPQRAVLAVTGTSDESVEWGLAALTQLPKPSVGNLAVVEADGTIRIIRAQAGSAEQLPSAGGDVPRVGQNLELWPALAEKWW